MTAFDMSTGGWLLLGLFLGIIGHKSWRVAWRARKHTLSIAVAFTDEFMPPLLEDKGKRKGPPDITEVG
jgi:hypothetical protein